MHVNHLVLGIVMNKVFVVLWIICCAFSTHLRAETQSQKVYTIGIVPQFESSRIRKIWKPIIKELEQGTGLKFKLSGSPTIPAFEKEFLAGHFDFAYMNPFHLLIANESQGYVPLVRDVGKKLYGILAVRKDSDIQSIQDLEGKTVAFPSPNALGASLQMRAEIHDKFNVNIDPKYVKTHDSVYLNVILRQTSAGGGVQKTLNRQKDKIQQILKIIHTTTPVAPHPLAAHPRVGEMVYQKVQQALLAIAESNNGKKLLSAVPVKQLGLATMDDYQPLENMNLKRFYVEQ